MKPKTYKTEGIVLARRNYSEADRIISVFSKGWGRISLLAKSVRKPKSRKRPHIEVFSYITFQAVKGKGIDLVTEVELPKRN
jgi:DNA repair protein RecO (recombination protein O)